MYDKITTTILSKVLLLGVIDLKWLAISTMLVANSNLKYFSGNVTDANHILIYKVDLQFRIEINLQLTLLLIK